MNDFMSRVIWIAAFLWLAPGTARAQVSPLPDHGQPQAAPIQPNATAVVRGHVVAGDTSQPLPRAQVRLIPLDGGTSRGALTESDGSYEIKNVAPGRYNISASKNAYITSQYGQTRPSETATRFEIRADQVLERVDFALPRGAVVRGRIVDEYGDAISRVQVTPVSWQMQGGIRRLVSSQRSVSTDDRGEFRLFALSPGDYFIQATSRPAPGGAGAADDRTGYPVTYFPSTTNAADAQRVRVGIGTITSDILIVMTSVPTAKVSGTAVDSRGQPLAGMIIMSNSSSVFNTAASTLRPDGSFSIANVTPGEYTLVVPQRGGSDENVATKVSVAGADIADVRLVGSKPVTVSGRILVDPGPPLDSGSLMIAAVPLRSDQMIGFGFTPPGKVNADFTFTMKVASGLRRLELNGLPTGWSVRAVRHHGVDVTDSGIEIEPNQNVDGIDVEVTSRVTTVTGIVADARGRTPADYTTVVFPQDRNLWTNARRYVKVGRPDHDGRFTIAGLPPGDYYAVARDHIDVGAISDPDFLDAVRADAIGFSLTEGETKAVELRLMTSGS